MSCDSHEHFQNWTVETHRLKNTKVRFNCQKMEKERRYR
nr:MAG TPA: hypothetical protein [Caudoviricetes sp.]